MPAYSNKSLPSINQSRPRALEDCRMRYSPIYFSICLKACIFDLRIFCRPWNFIFPLHHICICMYSWIRGSKMRGVDVCLHLCMCERAGGGGWQKRCWSSEAFLMSQGNQCQRRWLWWMPLRKQCVTMTSAWRSRRAKSRNGLTFSRLLLWRWPFKSLSVHPNVDLSLARW